MFKMLQRTRFARAVARISGVAALTLVLGWASLVAAQPTPAEENALKAAFVYNFAKYTDWPEPLWSKSTKLRVCITGPRDGFVDALAALDAKPPLRDRHIEVQRVVRPDEAAACHVLVVAGRQAMPDWLQALRTAPVLTVGDGEGFASGGGIIGLFVEGEKLRFEVNQDAAQRAGLKLSSQMLKLARLVKDGSAR